MFQPSATKEGGRPSSEGPTSKQVAYMSSKKVKMKISAPSKQDQNKRGTNISANAASGNQKPYMVVPYVKGLNESLKNVCRKHGVQVYYKGGNKTLLMAPKDKDLIYRYKCNRVECDDEYIGESSRTFGERFREHLKAPSLICDQFNITGHGITIENQYCGEGGPESDQSYQRSNIHEGE